MDKRGFVQIEVSLEGKKGRGSTHMNRELAQSIGIWPVEEVSYNYTVVLSVDANLLYYQNNSENYRLPLGHIS